MNKKISQCWVIKVTFYQNGSLTVNFNEAYTTYERAKSAVLEKIAFKNLHMINDYTWYDKENVIEYMLKLVDIFE